MLIQIFINYCSESTVLLKRYNFLLTKFIQKSQKVQTLPCTQFCKLVKLFDKKLRALFFKKASHNHHTTGIVFFNWWKTINSVITWRTHSKAATVAVITGRKPNLSHKSRSEPFLNLQTDVHMKEKSHVQLK